LSDEQEYSLEDHGYQRGLTSTEYVLKILDHIAELSKSDFSDFIDGLINRLNVIKLERPANAGSINMIRRIIEYVKNNGYENLVKFIEELKKTVVDACSKSAVIASRRVVDGDVIMTISNSMCLREMFRILVEKGVDFKVYVLESRPGMEGLDMADYLDRIGVETYLVIDSAARFFMKDVKKVFIGVESLASNGAVVGKVGTSILALAANEARVRVFAIAPTYKLGLETILGELIKIPEGDWRMLMSERIRSQLPGDYRVYVPLFDVTPPNLIDGIITEYGLFAPQALPFIIKNVYGSYPPEFKTIDSLINELIYLRGG